MSTSTPTDYRLAKELVVEGRAIAKGTLLSELRKRGGDWTNRVWVDRLIGDERLVPVRSTSKP